MLHHGAGEIRISLYNIERIASLPILGDVYEEFLPRNEDLMDDDIFSPTVLELHCIHAELYAFIRAIIDKTRDLRNGFFNGNRSKDLPGSDSARVHLPRFRVASHPDHRGRANPCFPIHYVVGWLAEVFPALYSQGPDSECPVDYPTLMRYTGMSIKRFTLAQARSMFRNGQSVSFRASTFLERSSKGWDLVDMNLSDEDFKFLLSIRSSVLHVRIGSELLLAPYYPHRFTQQFGFDQGVPANTLSFAVPLRQQRNMMNLA
ncbi:LOW QUALITY PROTEIN: hypothetical protein Cgig2_011621 [Carnegiea gigantea]|uniref:Uncharacterized protein n=1 Tax=Carnegiea gigantea TaxID=171969 RepID=A0A9Q1GQM9_9CARY|nr:LOW QUALITY PROTEIN: hypothetical protein Cgig2_011621 [Carnegiea gigantea]